MKQFNWQTAMRWLNARRPNERVMLLAGFVLVLGMVWLVLVHDATVAATETEARRLMATDGLIVEEQNRQNQIRGTYTSDPNTFALSRQQELIAATRNANERLNDLYGELISSQQMSQVLTTILQRDTTLRLISLENQTSTPLLTAPATPQAAGTPAVQVYRHGLRMVFEGNYLEAIRYLRSLEELKGNFFWESMEFRLTAYPVGQISLDIYTLSAERGWIGV